MLHCLLLELLHIYVTTQRNGKQERILTLTDSSHREHAMLNSLWKEMNSDDLETIRSLAATTKVHAIVWQPYFWYSG